MNSPSNREYRTSEPLQYPAEEKFDDHPRFAPDAPPLRSDEYDPVWVGENEAAPLRPAAPAAALNGASQRQPVDEEIISQDDLDRLEQIIASEQFRIRRRQAPAFIPAPPPVKQKRAGIRWAVGTFAVLLMTSSIIALQATDRIPIFESGNSEGGNQVARLASLLSSGQKPAPAVEIPSPGPATAKAPANEKPRLVVNGASADSPDQILLGVAVEGSTEGVSAVISGLTPGTTLTSGRAWGATGWIVPAVDVGTTYLRPPAGFSGMMEYSVALQMPDNSVVERQTMRLEWAGTSSSDQNAQPQQPAAQQPAAQQPAAQQPAAQQQAALPPAAQQSTVRHLDAAELASMVKRGEDLLQQGDIASSRLLLQRAAEAQDARAALTLAATYDPVELKRMGVYGAAPDVAKARDWYERARQYGSREAPRRLELLASQYR